jgi:hypothetical protein
MAYSKAYLPLVSAQILLVLDDHFVCGADLGGGDFSAGSPEEIDELLTTGNTGSRPVPPGIAFFFARGRFNSSSFILVSRSSARSAGVP